MTSLDAKRIALSGGLYFAAMGALVTLLALLKIPGYLEFCHGLERLYAWYGYSISVAGIAWGAFYGFIEGFVHLGLFAWLYNRLPSRDE